MDTIPIWLDSQRVVLSTFSKKEELEFISITWKLTVFHLFKMNVKPLISDMVLWSWMRLNEILGSGKH